MEKNARKLGAWGLAVVLVALLGPLIATAAIETANPADDPVYFPLEAFLLSAVAIALSATAINRSAPGRRLAVVALIVSVIAMAFAIGALGASADS